eukprot:scaffold4470_cov255-Prasinococcus_capsulatus_cf.AAC.6
MGLHVLKGARPRRGVTEKATSRPVPAAQSAAPPGWPAKERGTGCCAQLAVFVVACCSMESAGGTEEAAPPTALETSPVDEIAQSTGTEERVSVEQRFGEEAVRRAVQEGAQLPLVRACQLDEETQLERLQQLLAAIEAHPGTRLAFSPAIRVGTKAQNSAVSGGEDSHNFLLGYGCVAPYLYDAVEACFATCSM